MLQQISFLDSLYGKTFPEPSQATEEKTSGQYYRRSAKSVGGACLYLDLRTGSGNLLDAYWETVTALPGVSMTLNFGECPSVVRESTLSQILDLNAPEKYSLSAKACAGIVRRAEKRGKELPDMLMEALTETIGRAGGLESVAEDLKDEPEEENEDGEDF